MGLNDFVKLTLKKFKSDAYTVYFHPSKWSITITSEYPMVNKDGDITTIMHQLDLGYGVLSLDDVPECYINANIMDWLDNVPNCTIYKEPNVGVYAKVDNLHFRVSE